MLFHLPNLSTAHVKDSLAPWEFVSGKLPSFSDKKEFRAWCMSPTTEHYFYSAFEGLNPSVRISKENPPYRMHGLVVDYEGKATRAIAREFVTKNALPEFRPAWISTTFSGGVRLVWEFEQPIFCYNPTALKALLTRIRRQFKCDKLCANLDEGVFFKPDQFYEVGANWERFSDVRIPKKILDLWVYESGSKAKWSVEGTEIPIELVAEEVERQYPGRWRGDFVEGARGPRFWDPTADNETAAIVRSAGMQCFTGDTPFAPWGQILGAGFTREFQANRIATATDQIYYDNRHYWMKDEQGSWNYYNLENLQLFLRVDAMLSRETGKATHSEVDAAVRHIQKHNRVIAALPFVHRSKGLHRAPDGLYLNTSNVNICAPADGTQKWGEDFPWLGKFLSPGFFSSEDQWDFFFAWLRRFYKTAYEADMQPGHMVFIAGEVSQGKTLLGTKIIGPMMGGAADATAYLLGKRDWNDFLFARAVWNVDDPEPGKDPRTHAIYSANLKKHVANQEFDYQQKFRDGGRVTWTGRPIITLNPDEISLGMLPEVDISIMNKVLFFRTANRAFDFRGCEKAIREELPFFCRWLLDWEPPKHTQGDARYGVMEYHEPTMLQAAQERGRTSEFQDLLEIFLIDYFRDTPEAQTWTGNSAELYSAMNTSGATKDLIRRVTVHGLTKGLKMLQSMGNPDLELIPGRSRRPKWLLKRNLIGDAADEKSI